MSTTIGIRLGFQKRLRLHPPLVVEVIARVPSLPNPSAHCLAGWAGERRWHMPLPGAPSPRLPGVDSWVARQEANTAITLSTLQNCPIRIFVVDTACDLHPSLAAMLGSDLHPHFHVSAWCEHRDRCVRLIVPLLPDIQPLVGGRGAAAAYCGPRARLRVVLELRREASRSIVSHPHCHLVFAHRHRHPSVTICTRGHECHGD